MMQKPISRPGQALPYWQWNQIPLRWSGPVEKGQQVDLTLLSPRNQFIPEYFTDLIAHRVGSFHHGLRQIWQRPGF